MAQVKPRTLSGFMELLPAEQQKMELLLSALRESYSLYGYTPLDTPSVPGSLREGRARVFSRGLGGSSYPAGRWPG